MVVMSAPSEYLPVGLRTAHPATICFGIIDPTPVATFEGPVERRYKLDALTIEESATRVRLTCSCGRSDPFLLTREDWARAGNYHTLKACPICIQENKAAKSDTQKIKAWLNRVRPLINSESHIYTDRHKERLVIDGNYFRPRRLIYQTFYGVTLKQADKVLCSCGDSECLNPHHMMLAKSPARKITPQMYNFIQSCLQQNLRTRTISELLQQRFDQQVSQRSIQLIAKELRPSEPTRS